ncbi:MAG TPA: pilus assembly protein TadG-related protein [Candidatus Dormibacteraeota bacterium]|nr:pilus assembly protein TadG-related protein [Candidatus Dormibacteraeota bacterium]
MRRRRAESGQVLVIVAVWLVALIGMAALILLSGSVGWQRNQLQQVADQAALDGALRIGISCTPASARAVITEVDTFVATQRSRTGVLNVGASTCARGFTGTDTFAGGTTETIHYPYRNHQQQIEVLLTEALPISFGTYLRASNINVTRRAVAQQLSGSTSAVSATTLSCTGGQFNVAGSVMAQNLITRAGGCSVYAHARLDPASGTYSDLGNVSVYANGQGWVAGGGRCVAGGSAGSTNAICGDGFELTGHNLMTCGTAATTAFLSAADASINPNPCAAATGAQPVAPRSAGLPPEPNNDPAAIATLQGTGGVRCSPVGVYPNIVVNGVVVGTGLAPAPARDASGFYHFRPSCYGYLTPPAAAGAAIARVQTGPVRNGANTVTATLPRGSTAGNLLVVTLRETPTNTPSTGPAGWLFAAGVNDPTVGRTEIWYRPNAPAGITTATFTLNPRPQTAFAEMTEWRGVDTVAPLDQVGTTQVTVPNRNATVSTAGPMGLANELVVTDDAYTANGGQTFTPAAGWTGLVNNPGSGYSSEFRLNLPAGVASEAVRHSTPTRWSLAIATFRPAGASAGAVLDPGFYYFNGSGFVGGGGICLNGHTMLARDVTLEFVNRSGFSTGTCAIGGGAGCGAGACQFGSQPCSIAACPPNNPLDPARGGYTWFAAPCTQAPAGDAACPGSAWCPNGDRACSNLLAWSPATNTGRVAITGAAARNWLLGSIFWSGTCTYRVNATSTIDGAISCGNLSVSATAGAGTAVGSDYGVSTALAEAVLVE